jgi:U3 small nucleolar RNA-associated protein 13
MQSVSSLYSALCLLFDAMNFQIKGIEELVEGLIPYTQRHFGRTDRHLRNSFLFDYILTGMSVIEPEIDAKERKVESLTHSDVKNADGALLTENADAEQKSTSEDLKAESKKRKSKKSKDSSTKKARSVAYTKVEVNSLQA